MTPKMNLTKMDRKLKNSFYGVGNDIAALQNVQHELLRRIERLERMLMRKALQRQRTGNYVGNKHTGEVHTADCLLARSSEGHQQVLFPSRIDARRAGFSECICLA